MKDGRGGVSHVAGFCIFHLVSLKKGCIQNISFQYCLDWIKIRLYTENQNPYISLYFIYLCQKTPPPPILFINHFKSLRTESLKMEKIFLGWHFKHKFSDLTLIKKYILFWRRNIFKLNTIVPRLVWVIPRKQRMHFHEINYVNMFSLSVSNAVI